MVRTQSRTVTLAHDETPRDPRHVACLFVVHVGQSAPFDARTFVLDAPCSVHLGRGRGTARMEEAPTPTLHIQPEDPWMSTRHAVVRAALGAWVLEDAGAKNKTRHNGRPVDRALLADGDVIEVGRTVLVFRTSVRVPSPRKHLPPDARVEPLRSLLPAVETEMAKLAELADTGVPVLLHGESGTGKEALARTLHALSGRKGNFVVVPCGAITGGRAHDALLGAVRGTVPGVDADREGLLARAHQGTLLLDEYGDLSAPAQAALLRALEDGSVTPVGSDAPARVDLRVVATTRHDPDALVRDGTICPDLYARLAGFVLRTAPLRERREDVGLLASRVLARLGSACAIEPAVIRQFLWYSWPRNLREFDQTLTAALALAGDGPLRVEHFPEALRAAAPEPVERAPAPAAPVTPTVTSPPSNASSTVPRFELEGEMWRVTYASKTVHMKDADGLRYLAWLVDNAGVEVHASDLLGRVRAQRATGGREIDEDEAAASGLDARHESDAGPLLDEAAKRAYKQRAEALRDAIEEATGWGDIERASKAQAELDLLTDELSRAVGLGGRDRKAGSASERARVNVTVRIRKTLKKIEELHPPLGHHLAGCVRTGAFCCYVPPP